MIKIENVETYGWETAIRGMRNPLESWAKSDSCPYWDGDAWDFAVADEDLELMSNLISAGDDHGKFARMITVTCDITAPLYWWKEFDTYKVGTVANSCSTMHRIHAKEFTLKDFSREHLDDTKALGSLEILRAIVYALNVYREAYIETKDKKYWWQMIQLLPSSYNQLRTVQLNYQVLRHMYHARKNHKLDEWREFCQWVEKQPYSELITGVKKDE